MTSTTITTTAQQSVLIASMESIGWELQHIDIDMVAVVVKVEARRFDGRVVRVFATKTSSYIEVEDTYVRHFTFRGLPEARREPLLLNRTRCLGTRHAVLKWCHYLADNPNDGMPALSRVDMMRLVGPLFKEQ